MAPADISLFTIFKETGVYITFTFGHAIIFFPVNACKGTRRVQSSDLRKFKVGVDNDDNVQAVLCKKLVCRSSLDCPNAMQK